MINTIVDWKYPTESDTACQAFTSGCMWPRGKMLGGSSSMNSMQYIRGHEHDYDHWSELGNADWDFESVLKYFKKTEGNQNKDLINYKNGKYHSGDGPIKVNSYGLVSPFAKIFIDGGAEMGIPFVDDINADKHIGYLHAQGTLHQGRRDSSAKAFLIPAKNRTNLHIIKNAHVEKLIIDENNRVNGVTFTYDGTHQIEVNATKEVILSAGSVNSAQLLMLSGIGLKEHLQEHNIPVKSDLPVGQNLHDHIGAVLWLSFYPTETSKTSQFDNIYNLAIHNSGDLTSIGILQTDAFININKTDTIADYQIHLMYQTSKSPSSFADGYIPEVREKLLEENQNHDLASISIIVLQPKSRGNITIKSTSPYDKPSIQPNYFSDPHDMDIMLQAVKHQLSFLNTKSYRKNGGKFFKIPLKKCDQIDFENDFDNYLKCYIKHFTRTIFHPVGTSKMGPDSDRSSVVDSKLKVRNVTGLRQIDAGM